MADYTLLLAELVEAVQQINTNYDGQKLLDALKLVDGDGSGLDADMLDGKHAGEFVTALKTPQELLDDIKTVDGKGSGLDADLFRGFADRLSIGTDKGESFKQLTFSGDGGSCITLSTDPWGNSSGVAFNAYRSENATGTIWANGQWKFFGDAYNDQTKAFLIAWEAASVSFKLFQSQGNHVADDDIQWQEIASLDTLINPTTLVAKYIEGSSLPATGENGEIVAWFDGSDKWRLAVWFDNINNWKVVTLV